MRDRHLSNSFTRFGADQQDNNHMPVEHSYFPSGRGENGPFVGQNQMSHMSRGHRSLVEGGSSRANEYPPPPPPPSSNISMEVQPPFVPPFSHPSITENRCFPPGGHHAHYTNYNHLPNTHDMESGPLNHHHPTPNGGGGGPLKRKRSGSLNSLYTVGSSSSSSQMPIEKSTLDPYRGNLTIDGQDSSRHVRRRYRHDDMESESSSSITRSHVPNHFYQSPPLPHPPPPPPPNYSSAAPHVPHYPAPSHIREINGGSRHEMNQFHVGGSSGDPGFSRQNLHVHANNHSRRIHSSYGSGSRYSHSHYGHGHGAASSSTNGNGNGLRTPPAPENFSPRNSRHWSPNGWRGHYSHRSGRPRIAVERFHSVVDVNVTESHETLMMVDRGASLYGNSRNFSDQYRDLRLDIDNMSYEELLNLEERIGSVNTGLSEDSMSKCLREKVYYSSSDQNHEEVSCPICLEEYKNGDAIGMMERCGHGYHVDCIKKWLLMKKLCPICKTECSNPNH